MDKDYTWGKQLREYRLMRGMTIYELADKVGIDFTYLSKIECDRVDPPRHHAVSTAAECHEQKKGVLPARLRD